MRAYCGLQCDVCEVYLATVQDDDTKRVQVAEQWSKKYGWSLSPRDINCRGCTNTGQVIFGFCKTCAVRKCARAKKIKTCLDCPEVICDKLETLCKIEPEIRELLKKSDGGS